MPKLHDQEGMCHPVVPDIHDPRLPSTSKANCSARRGKSISFSNKRLKLCFGRDINSG